MSDMTKKDFLKVLEVVTEPEIEERHVGEWCDSVHYLDVLLSIADDWSIVRRKLAEKGIDVNFTLGTPRMMMLALVRYNWPAPEEGDDWEERFAIKKAKYIRWLNEWNVGSPTARKGN